MFNVALGNSLGYRAKTKRDVYKTLKKVLNFSVTQQNTKIYTKEICWS